jgi:hypothetical protein
MPFTFSHPSLLLPLTRLPRKWVSATGLVAGSIIPDFEKFLKMNDGNTYSHTVPGTFWFYLPLAVLLSFVFHQVVRDPLIDNLPGFLRARCGPARSFNWVAHVGKHYPAVLFSLLLGIVSHLVWDHFTHRPAPPGRPYQPRLKEYLFPLRSFAVILLAEPVEFGGRNHIGILFHFKTSC